MKMSNVYSPDEPQTMWQFSAHDAEDAIRKMLCFLNIKKLDRTAVVKKTALGNYMVQHCGKTYWARQIRGN
jgi:hypothetical protein